MRAKDKYRAQIELENRRQAQRERFDEQINELIAQTEELRVEMVNADEAGSEQAVDLIFSSLCYIENQIQKLRLQKINMNVAAITANVNAIMIDAVGMLSEMAENKVGIINSKKMQKAKNKITNYMMEIAAGERETASVLKDGNPATKTLSPEQKKNRDLVLSAQKLKMGKGISMPDTEGLQREIESERNRPLT